MIVLLVLLGAMVLSCILVYFGNKYGWIDNEPFVF